MASVKHQLCLLPEPSSSLVWHFAGGRSPSPFNAANSHDEHYRVDHGAGFWVFSNALLDHHRVPQVATNARMLFLTTKQVSRCRSSEPVVNASLVQRSKGEDGCPRRSTVGPSLSCPGIRHLRGLHLGRQGSGCSLRPTSPPNQRRGSRLERDRAARGLPRYLRGYDFLDPLLQACHRHPCGLPSLGVIGLSLP